MVLRPRTWSFDAEAACSGQAGGTLSLSFAMQAHNAARLTVYIVGGVAELGDGMAAAACDSSSSGTGPSGEVEVRASGGGGAAQRPSGDWAVLDCAAFGRHRVEGVFAAESRLSFRFPPGFRACPGS